MLERGRGLAAAADYSRNCERNKAFTCSAPCENEDVWDLLEVFVPVWRPAKEYRRVCSSGWVSSEVV